jgi:rubrerythrin
MIHSVLGETGAMTDRERLQEALKHEENAVSLYRQFAREADDARLQEMFEQFAMNESWHAAAIREKLGEPQT